MSKTLRDEDPAEFIQAPSKKPKTNAPKNKNPIMDQPGMKLEPPQAAPAVPFANLSPAQQVRVLRAEAQAIADEQKALNFLSPFNAGRIEAARENADMRRRRGAVRYGPSRRGFMTANFRDPIWRRAHLQGKRISLSDWLAGQRNADRFASGPGKYRISKVAKGLLRSKRMREIYWPILLAVTPSASDRITNKDATNALVTYERRKATAAGARLAKYRKRGISGAGAKVTRPKLF